MLMPSLLAENLFDDWFDFPSVRNVDRQLYGRHYNREMRTDVKEHEDHFEVDIDLPGFQKDQVQLTLENGYLTVTAAKGLEKDQTEKGKVIR